MRMYKLSLDMSLIDLGEMPDESSQEQSARHPLLKDPLQAQKELLDRAQQMMSQVSTMGRPREPVMIVRLGETYDCPSENLQDALKMLVRFHDLCNEMGVPATISQGPPRTFGY